MSRPILFGIAIDAVDTQEAVATLLRWIDRRERRCRYVVTPNIDHIVMLERDAKLQAAYQDADLVVADGMPVVVASWLLRQPLPERVAGADLVPALFAASGDRRLTVFLLGAAPGVGERAAREISRHWPSVEVVGTCSPPPGFEHDETMNRQILERIAAVTPDVLVVGLGAPKQELWVHRHLPDIEARIAFCVGATIDFLAGEKPRAPAWLRNSGFEWTYRLACEPRRLFRRYARDAWVFPRILFRELVVSYTGRTAFRRSS